MAAPLNTVLPTLDMGVTSWTGTVGSWDENGGGTVSYAWELRLVEDDSVVESGGGSLPQGTGTYNNANGYYLKVDATNTGGTTEARSKVGTLGIGLSGWWSPSIADSAEDLSSEGNDGSLLGGMSTVADTSEGGSRAFDFDGVDDRVDFGDILDTEIFTTGNPFTLSGWAQIGSDGVVVFAKILDSSAVPSAMNERQFVMWCRDAGGGMKFEWTHYGTLGTSSYRGYRTVANLNVGDWYHLTAVYNGPTGSNPKPDLYIDGTLASTTLDLTNGTDSAMDNGAASLSTGAGSGGSFYTFPKEGRTDDLRVYNRSLSPAEINELYTQGRGYDHRPKGLGDEVAWYCPSIENSPNDLSGNGNNGTYNGGMGTVTAAGAGGSRAFDFDGIDDWIEAGTLSNGGSISGSCWFKSTQTSANAVLFGCWGGAGGAIQTFRVDRLAQFSDYIRIYTRDVNGALKETNSISPAWPSNEWVHVAWSYQSGGDLILYQDGVEINRVSAGADIRDQQGTNIHIGAEGGGVARFAEGLMDDIRIINRVITPEEVAHLASGRGVTGSPVQGLGDEVAWYCPTLSGNAGDLSGNGNAGTYNGGMGVIDEVGSGGKKAFEFDGVDDYISTGSTSVHQNTLFSYSFWINASASASGTEGTIGSYETTGNHRGPMAASNASDSKMLWTYQSLGNAYNTSQQIYSLSDVYDSTWRHIVCEFDGNNNAAKIYVDGVLDNSTSSSVPSTVNISTPLKIGSGGNGYTQGYLDDIRVFDRALTEAEITHLASDRGVQGGGPSEVDLDYLWSPTQGAETAVGPIANIGSAGTQDVDNVSTIAWVSDTDKNGTDAVDLAGNAYYRWTSMSITATAATVGCWVRCVDADESGYILGLGSNSASLFLASEFRSGGQIRLWSGGISTQVSDGGITKTDWNHIALTYNNTTTALFLNGSKIVSHTPSSPTTYTDLKFGTAGGSVFGVEGRMDGMFFQTSVLSGPEIALLAVDRTYPLPAPPPPTGAWKNPFRNSFFYNPFFDNEAL